jgi:4-amino-4-deoxy-L-arabinose transferase-like glycosyltransferase
MSMADALKKLRDRTTEWVEAFPERFILLFASVFYLPFFPFRLVRFAGDEKVYAQQLLEMSDAGRWFVQTLFGEPSYYKGPLFYLLTRVSTSVLGMHAFSVLFWNWASITIAALAVFRILDRRLKNRNVAISTALWLISAIGVYSYTFSTQMEALLIGPIAGIAYLLDQERSRRELYWLWIIIGLLGTIKSPLHSVFLGVSALGFWATEGSLSSRIRDRHFYGSIAAGVAASILPFVPILIQDFDHFWATYVIREHAGKASGLPFWDPIRSTFFYYLAPFLGIAVAAYLSLAVRFKRVRQHAEYSRVFALGAWVFAPSLLFFAVYSYRFEFYHLPVISGVFLWMGLGMALLSELASSAKIFRWAMLPSQLLATLVYGVLIGLAIRTDGIDEWLSVEYSLAVLAFSVLLVTSTLFFRFQGHWHVFALVAGSMLGLSLVLLQVGERELAPLKEFQGAELGYYNLSPKIIWNEAGLTSLYTTRWETRIRPLTSQDAVRNYLQSGRWLLVHRRQFRGFKRFLKRELGLERSDLERLPWTRWGTRPLTGGGKESRIFRVWNERSLRVYEAQYGIFRLPPAEDQQRD